VKRFLLIVGAAAAALLIVVSLRGGGDDLELVAVTEERAAVDLGERGPSLGDQTVTSGALLDDDGDPAGRHDGVCTVTSAPDSDEDRRVRCAVTLTVGTDNGETELQLAAVGREAADDVRYSIVGGGGEYADAGGDALFVFTDGDRTRISVDLDD
jgi:hypothetical protein